MPLDVAGVCCLLNATYKVEHRGTFERVLDRVSENIVRLRSGDDPKFVVNGVVWRVSTVRLDDFEYGTKNDGRIDNG